MIKIANIYDIHRETRDNIGSQDENKNLILVGLFPETIGIEEGATRVRKRDVGSSFVLGHAANGLLGTIQLGENSMGDYSVQRVVNPNNTFHEHFRFNTFVDTTNTTGTVDVATDFCVNLELNEVFQTEIIFKNLESVNFVTLHSNISGGSTEFIVSGTNKSVSITEGKTQSV